MTRYKYNTQHHPPAPFLYVVLTTVDGARKTVELPAQMDCAADQTVVPRHLIDELSIEALDSVTVGGLNGSIFTASTYMVVLSSRNLKPKQLEVLAFEGERYVLLGRDFLNDHRVLLDGPALALEIE